MNLRELRNINGYKRGFIADKLGITGDHLNAIERCDARITMDRAYILAELYQEDVEKIINLNKKGVD